MNTRFAEEARRSLIGAKEEYDSKNYTWSVIKAHRAAESTMKAFLIREGFLEAKKMAGEELLRTFSEKQNILKGKIITELDVLRTLRNEVYHEAYSPAEEEARFAVETAKKAIRPILEKISNQ